MKMRPTYLRNINGELFRQQKRKRELSGFESGFEVVECPLLCVHLELSFLTDIAGSTQTVTVAESYFCVRLSRPLRPFVC